MDTHKNARLTYARRLDMVQDIMERGFSCTAPADRHRSIHSSVSAAACIPPENVRHWLAYALAHCRR